MRKYGTKMNEINLVDSKYPNANPPSNGGYGIYGNLSTSSYDLSLLKMESLVPTNATVLSQFNMPQFSDRYYFTFVAPRYKVISVPV